MRAFSSPLRRAFTLIELMVAVAVLSLLIVMVADLFASASRVTTTGAKTLDADMQSRALFDRLAIDLAQMYKRPDLDYYLKTPSTPQPGNDQLAFFSEVTGYFPASGARSTASLVAYRINSRNALERMGKGLTWGNAPGALVYLPLTIPSTWPAAAGAQADGDYEELGPLVFRFEYFYLLKGGGLTATPWSAASTSVDGFKDVAAIGCAVAVIDARSRKLVTDAELSGLAATMKDFVDSTQPGDLLTGWQATVKSSDLPIPVKSAIHFYHRFFYLGTPN